MVKTRVGLLGAGYMAEKHLEVLKDFEDVEVVAIASNGSDRAARLAEKYGVAAQYTNHKDLLEHTQLDCVFVTVNVLRVPEVSAACLELGLPTLLEKPPGLYTSDALRLRDIALGNDCINMVALNRRFYSVMRRAREAILERGRLIAVSVEAPERLGSFKTGAHPTEVVDRLIVANGIHCVDLLRFFGGEVAELHAFSGEWCEGQLDSFGGLMRFANGTTGHYISHWPSPSRWSVTLYGERCRVLIAPLEHAVLFEPGAEIPLEVDEVDVRYKTGLYHQNRYFIDCVQTGTSVGYPGSDLVDAVKTMQLIDGLSGAAS